MRNKKKFFSLVIFLLILFYFHADLLSSAPADLTADWTKYRNSLEAAKIMKELAEKYKNMSKVYSIGKSFQGQDIWCMEITNYSTGNAETKPGMYIDGNTHAGEVSGAEVCLYTIHYLLTNYGKDPLATKLLDGKVFYIIPKVNPDGSDAYLKKPGEPVDPKLKKVDDDRDGLLDEDGAEDLNGDGIISTMRIRDEKGPLKTSPKDPRLMVQRKIDESGEWRIIGPEGLDNDKDGRLNEDPPGSARSVSNRNFPADWVPEWIQSGSGIYPLSEPETKAAVDFVHAHPNIAGWRSYHTHSGVILRPLGCHGDEVIPAEDLRDFQAIGAMGTEITGYPLLSLYNDFTTDKSHPRYGNSMDWSYGFLGLSVIGVEIWKAPDQTGRTAFEGQDEKQALEWNDRELGGKGFVNWKKFNHLQYGEVEIGGWNSNYVTQNPPAKFMEAEWKKNSLFDIKHAELLPLLKIAEVKAIPLGDKVFRINVTVENEGFLPTNVTTKAIQNGLAKPVSVKLELDNAELLFGKEKVDIGHIKGTAPFISSFAFALGGGTSPQNRKTAEFLVRTKGGDASLKITAISERAGTVTQKIKLT